ncbi:MAG: GNAT family N-acetyltransferase, partial [Pseudomonadota bacterium]
MFDLPPSPASAPSSSTMPRAQAQSADVLSCRPLQQTALYGRASAQMGADIRPLRLPDWQAWVVHRKVQALGSVAMLSRGPSLINAAQARALRPATGARHLIVHAEDATSADALAAAGFWSIARPTPVAELHLTGSPAEMAARLDGKWRNRLRHALKMNVTVTQGPMSPDTGHWLFTAEAQRAHDLGYRPMPPALVAAMSEAPGAAHLFTARRGGGVIAAMLFLRHGRRATYQIG